MATLVAIRPIIAPVTNPVLPDYAGASLAGLMPELLGHGAGYHGFPVDLSTGEPVVLLVLDGLGWEQLRERTELAPTLAAMSGGPITSVAPSTTATALTSITTGLVPGEHGIVGYRMVLGDDVVNTLRWASSHRGDVRRLDPPEEVQPFDPFLGEAIPTVTRAEFVTSGFSRAHLRGGRFVGYRTVGTLIHQVARLLEEGSPLVYAYYDGVDKVAHEYGLGPVYDAEVRFADLLVAAIIDRVPTGTRVVVTADHGQVHCEPGTVELAPAVMESAAGLSGEGRFRWVHARSGRESDLLVAAEEAHGDVAWVRSLEQILDEQWFGPSVSAAARRRLGDVALVPIDPIAFGDPDDTGPFELIGRHGSLTAAEMLVPLLAATA